MNKFGYSFASLGASDTARPKHLDFDLMFNETLMTPLPDFSDALKKRHGKSIDIELADSELRLDPKVPVLTSCPAVFWSGHNANFVICKLGDRHFRGQFYPLRARNLPPATNHMTICSSASRCCYRYKPITSANSP